MTRLPRVENKTNLELVLAGKAATHTHLENGLFQEQKLTCANHSDEVVLDKIGWRNFLCPKCGCDYSIGRKIAIKLNV